MAAMEITGRRFGQLVVLRRVVIPGARNSMWLCHCDCGNDKILAGNSMTLGGVKSCGCMKRGPKPKPGRKTETRKRTVEYTCWSSMVQRCTNPKSNGYHNYGGRGIAVDKNWLLFDNFFADMGLRPSPRHTLERKDTNAGYTKENCRWATHQEQMWNIRANVFVTWQGQKKCIGEWSKIVGIHPSTLHSRIVKKGWSVEKAMTTPVQQQVRVLTLDGQSRRVYEWAEITGIPEKRIDARLRRGWSVQRTLTTPVLPKGRPRAASA